MFIIAIYILAVSRLEIKFIIFIIALQKMTRAPRLRQQKTRSRSAGRHTHRRCHRNPRRQSHPVRLKAAAVVALARRKRRTINPQGRRDSCSVRRCLQGHPGGLSDSCGTSPQMVFKLDYVPDKFFCCTLYVLMFHTLYIDLYKFFINRKL